MIVVRMMFTTCCVYDEARLLVSDRRDAARARDRVRKWRHVYWDGYQSVALPMEAHVTEHPST